MVRIKFINAYVHITINYRSFEIFEYFLETVLKHFCPFKIGFIASTMYYPMFVNEDTAECDFEAFNTGNERSLRVKRLVYSSPKAQANLRKVIPLYNSMGLFD